jgi:type II secretory pathway predicted ATPase ExeA
VPAVQRLREWATDRSATARHLCALLGDVGMGKTTTIKLFTQEPLDLRARDRSAPLPILFDLPLAVVRAGAILTVLLEGEYGGQRPPRNDLPTLGTVLTAPDP